VSELRVHVGAGYVTAPIVMARRRGASFDAPDASCAQAVGDWLAPWAAADAIPAWVLDLYRPELDERSLASALFRERLEHGCAALLRRQAPDPVREILVGPVLVPLLVACERAHPGVLAQGSDALARVVSPLGQDVRAILEWTGFMAAEAAAGSPREWGREWLPMLEQLASLRQALLRAADGPSLASRLEAPEPLDPLEACVLRRFDRDAMPSARPKYLAVLGDALGPWADRLVECIARQDEAAGRARVAAPVVVPASPEALEGVSMSEVLPVCLLTADPRTGLPSARECQSLRGLVEHGSLPAIVWIRHESGARDLRDADGLLCALLAGEAEVGHAAETDAAAFLMHLAGEGVFPATQPQGFPMLSRRPRATLLELEARDFRIRPGRPGDLESLCRLEDACWPEPLRMPHACLARRVEGYPEGQLVLETDAADAPPAVVGVIYSQRIASVQALSAVDAGTVDGLHRAAGPVVQLLAVNVDPAFQSRRFGDQLLEFMLQRSTAQSDVASVAAVTLCRDFHAQTSLGMDAYVRLRNPSGVLADPVLRFHELHGACIERAMPGYRPLDVDNRGYGVLVTYDLARRSRQEIRPETTSAPPRGDAQAASGDAVADAAQGLPDPAALHEFLETSIRRILRRDADLVYAPDMPLMQLGLDSVGLLELAEALALRCRMALDTTFLFRHNTPARIVEFFAQRRAVAAAAPATLVDAVVLPAGDDTAARPEPRRPAPDVARPAPDAIAVIGMACRLPGGLDTPEKFWACLEAGECVVGTLPPGRWNWPRGIDPADSHRGIDKGGFLDDIQSFDAGLFRLSPKEVETMDPQQRILLELAWEAMERAGLCMDAVAGSRTGVYVGASGSDYRLLMETAGIEAQAHMATGGSMAVIANRISFAFDLRGPSIQVDTACSSSLVALHQAAQALRLGECEQALVAGINIICHPGNTLAYYKAGMLSRDGRCKTLDKSADGYVRSEGAVMLVLKPLARAVEDGDPVHAVIRGGACNHGGLAGGLTVPNPDRQAELVRAAWAASGVSADSIGHVELHGTGTRLGDPIELRGLTDAFGASGQAPGQGICAISSVKSNLGHLEAAAGLAGVLKVILSLTHGALPRTVNFRHLNAQIRLEGTPFRVVDTLTPWTKGRGGAPRRAGVSSFGSGGANAHVILEEHAGAPAAPTAPAGELLFVLSARSRDQLLAHARALADFCARAQSAGDAPGAQSVAFTLQRRQPMPERAAFVARSLGELAGRLGDFAAGVVEPGTWFGNATRDPSVADFVRNSPGVKDVVAGWLRERQLAQIAKWWTSGVEIGDWSALYAARPSRIALPCHPFARERYWIQGGTAPSDPAGTAAPAYLMPPRLQAVAADAQGRCFDVSLAGDEFFLADHRLQDKPILPGVVQLELARAAWAAMSGEAEQGVAAFQLSDVVWIKPIEGEAARALHLRLRPRDTSAPAAMACDYEILTAPTVVHGRGMLEAAAPDQERRWDLPLLRASLGRQRSAASWNADACYQAFDAMGLRYGPAHRAIRQVKWGHDDDGAPALLARLVAPACVAQAGGHYVLHPSLMDGAAQAGLLLAQGAAGREGLAAAVPFALKRLVFLGSCPDRLWVWARRRAPGKGSQAALPAVDLDLCDDEGRVLIRLQELAFRPVRASAGAPLSPTARGDAAPRLLRLRWDDRPLAPAREAGDAGDEHRILLCGADPRTGFARHAAQFQARLPHVSVVAIASEGRDPAARFTDVAAQVFESLRGSMQRGKRGRATVQIVVPDAGPDRVLGALSGLARTARLEHPGLVVQVLAMDAASEVSEMAARLLAERAQGRQAQVEYRQGRRHVVVAEEAPEPAGAGGLPWREGGVYLISGGAGGLGLAFSKEILASTRRATVIRMGRSAPHPALLAGDGAGGARLRHERVDVRDAAAVSALVSRLRAEHGSLSGVIHAAGLTRDEFMQGKRRDTFEAVLGPKVAGTLNLYESTRGCGLDFFVSFSSIVAVTGNPGQSDYCVGNAFLDEAARERAQGGACGHGRVLSIAWPLWREGGMGRQPAVAKHFERTLGLAPMETADGIAAFYRALATQEPHVVVVNGRPDRVMDLIAAPAPLAEPPAAPKAAAPIAAPALAIAQPPASAQAVEDYLKRVIGAVLGHAPAKLAAEAAFSSYGMDSILALDIIRALELDLGSLSKTLFFEYENIRELGSYLREEYAEALERLLRRAAQASARTADEAPATDDATLPSQAPTPQAMAARAGESPRDSTPFDAPRLIRKSELSRDPEAAALLARIDDGAPRGAALLKVWPELFIGADGQGYCHVLVDRQLLFATQYTGPAQHREALFAQLLAYCGERGERGLEFGYLDLTEHRKPELESRCGLVATPVGVVQVIENLREFSLAGGAMRRLRYMVERFRKQGAARTVECTRLEPALVADIQRVICAWSETKKVVNNVDVVLDEIAAGRLLERYRVFLTYLDDQLQNVIMVASESTGYLMDQEYYLPGMPLGGTEYAVVEIIATLAAQGCDRFSLGLTWGLFDTGEGCGDAQGSAFLANTRTQLQQIFERGIANRQYKSKYGTRDFLVHLYRRAGDAPATLAACLSQFYRQGISYREVQRRVQAAPAPVASVPEDVCEIVADTFDATRADPAAIRIDLVSDSWAHLDYPFIRERAGELGARASRAAGPATPGAIARIFGFERCLLAASGRLAERVFFQTMRRSGKKRVLQNILFESTLHHLVKSGFEPVEMPDPLALQPDARALFRGGIDLPALERELESRADQTAMVLLELCDNASGGYPVSLAQIEGIARACRLHGVPLAMDVTRILKNAELIRRHEKSQAGRDLWEIVSEIAGHADAIVGSLCKDFGLGVGGVMAARDAGLVANAQGLARIEGGLLAPVEAGRVEAGLADRDYLQSRIARQLDRVADLHRRLEREGVPVIQPGAGHCVLVRVDQLPAQGRRRPSRERYLRLLLERHGIRGGLHLVGNRRDTALNQCIRLAVPLGLDDARLTPALVGALKASLSGADHATPDLMREPSLQPKPPSPRGDDSIAVIGLAGCYPGARTLRAFWRNLMAARCAISEIPPERWDWRAHFEPDAEQAVAQGKAYGKWGAFLDDFSAFDPLFFNIAPIEAGFMDPQERLFLQACWHALEDAGQAPSSFSCELRAKVGVFGGITKQGFNLHGVGQAQPFHATSLAAFVNRVSHCLDLKGPAVANDSHCASALVAIHEACNYLRREPGGLALAGAVNLNLHPSTYAQLSKLQVLAIEGASAAFARQGSGYVPGEGVGVIVLKNHRQALADGDPIHAVIRGSAVNHNGRMNRFGMPSQKQQAAVVRAALAQEGLEPGTIGYIEASAHGSLAGDAIEMAALTEVFGQREALQGSYRIGSVKPNIGHGEAVSGMAQLTKVLLAFRHRQLPPTLMPGEPSPAIDFSKLPFELQAAPADWEALHRDGTALPRRAGITSTGASGLNAHLVLEEHVPEAVQETAAARPDATKEKVFVLSARDRARLLAYARRWIEFLAEEPPADLDALTWSMQVGREAMACRLAILATDGADLLTKLLRWCDGTAADEARDVFDGERLRASKPDAVHDGAGADESAGAIDPRRAAQSWAQGKAVDWGRLHPAGARPRRLSGLPVYPFATTSYWPGPAASAQAPQAPAAAAAVAVAEAHPVAAPDAVVDARASLLSAFIPKFTALVASIFQVPAAEFDLERPLEDYGINSFLVKVLNSLFAEAFGEVSRTLLFEYRTAGELARHFAANHEAACAAWAGAHAPAPRPGAAIDDAAPASSIAASPPARRARAAAASTWDEPIAIIGASGRYPDARDLAEFWENLKAGRDSITSIPPERWSLDGFYEEDIERAIGESRSYGKWGGFIDGFAEFDPLFFNLSPREAANMDPQERIFLQACWQALEDAGYSRGRIARQHRGRLGVFAGITRSEFSLYGNAMLKMGKAPSTSFCSLVNRVSYVLDANGPSMPIDTMCSSSLVALHEACEKLRGDECEVALAGGVNLSLHPYMYVSLSAQRMLSRDGRCKAFGKGGNGYVPGEGVGVLVLKPLARALADGDSIHALIRGTSVNHGGKTNGYTVPNPVAQGRVIRSALDRAGLDARAISYIEAHGTGTELGDPIEITGLASAFARDTTERGFCAIGSVKSNIGHLEAASGIAGVTKVLLQMKHGLLVPSLHADELNPLIDFASTPFIVNRAMRAWQRPVVDGRELPRLAGVSSFGAGGTNAHAVLEEHAPAAPAPAPATREAAPEPVLIVLSARKPELLQRYAQDMLAHVRAPEYREAAGAQRLRSLAYTLQVGREAMDMRLGLVVKTVQELEDKLQRFVDGESDIEDLHVARVGRSQHHVL